MSRPRLAAKARLRWDAREKRYLLLYPERGLSLSDSAAAILKLCDGSRSVDGIGEELARDRSAEDRATIQRDVITFLDEMRRRGLITFEG